jgi:serine/threonine protein kinase
MVIERCDDDFLNHIETVAVLDERSLGAVFAQMLSGIRHLHSVRVIHRDVKPDNFMVGGKDGKTLKLGDFGLAVTKPRWTSISGVAGTAPFMCPEMVNHKSYDEKADVWSFGVIVYSLLFGTFPYWPLDRSSKAMMRAIARARPAPKFMVASQSCNEFESTRSEYAMAFVKSLLMRKPQERPSAIEAASMPYMIAVAEQCHVLGVNLPSLRPMLSHAKRDGLFALRHAPKVAMRQSGDDDGKLGIPWHHKYLRL